jgi:hypothetical protein
MGVDRGLRFGACHADACIERRVAQFLDTHSSDTSSVVFHVNESNDNKRI